MLRLLQRGGNCLAKQQVALNKFFRHQVGFYQPGATFSTLEVPDPNSKSKNLYEQYKIIPEEYDEKVSAYIKSLQGMKIMQLRQECRRFPNKEKLKTRDEMIRFILTNLPKKSDGSSNSIDALSSPPQQEQAVEEPEDYSINEDQVNEELQSSIRRSNLVRQKVISSPILRDFCSHIIKPYEDTLEDFNPLKNDLVLPSLEHSKTETQIIGEITKMKTLEMKRECELFLSRTKHYWSKGQVFLGRIKKVPKLECKSVFRDMILLYRERRLIFVNCIKKIIQEPLVEENEKKGDSAPEQHWKHLEKGEFAQIIRILGDWYNTYLHEQYLQTVNPNEMSHFQEVVFSHAHKLDPETIDRLLGLLHRAASGATKGFTLPNESSMLELLSDICKSFEEKEMKIRLTTFSSIIYSISNLLPAGNLDPEFKAVYEKAYQIFQLLYNEEWKGINAEKLGVTPGQVYKCLASFLTISQGSSTSIHYRGILEDIYEKFVECGVQYIDKRSAMSLLEIIKRSSVTMTRSFGRELAKNTKMMEEMNMIEIYLIISSFSDGGIELGNMYNQLFNQFKSLTQVNFLEDIETIKAAARIMHYMITTKRKWHRPASFERIITQVFALLENSIDLVVSMKAATVNDLLEICTYFIPIFNRPNFLFGKLAKLIDDVAINNDTKNLLNKFVTRLLTKYEDWYTYQKFLNGGSAIEFNDKFTREAIEIFRVLLPKFNKSNLLSFILLSLQISTNETLLSRIYPGEKERKEHFDYLLRQISSVCSSTQNLTVSTLTVFSKFLFVHNAQLNPKLVPTVLDNLFNTFIRSANIMGKPPAKYYNVHLPWLYYLSSAATKVNPVDLPTAAKNQLENVTKKMREFVTAFVVPPFLENANTLTTQIIYDQNVSQTFCANLKNSAFNHLEYLLPVFDNLKMPLKPNIQYNLVAQGERAVKSWQGELLLRNLLLFDKHQIHAAKIYIYAIDNLFTLFHYFHEDQSLELNSKIAKEPEVLGVLRAYINQLYGTHADNKSSDATFHPPQKNTLPLCTLANTVSEAIPDQDLFKLIGIIGKSRKSYMTSFLAKFQARNFSALPLPAVVEALSKCPQFLRNESLEKAFFSQIDDIIKTKLQPTMLNDLVKVLLRENLYLVEKKNDFLQSLKGLQGKTLAPEQAAMVNNYLTYFARFCRIESPEVIINIINTMVPLIPGTDLYGQTNLLALFTLLRHRNKEAFKKSQQGNIFYGMMKKLVPDLLKSNYFHFTDYTVEIDGKMVRVQYYPSFELEVPEVETNIQAVKIYPRTADNSPPKQRMSDDEDGASLKDSSDEEKDESVSNILRTNNDEVEELDVLEDYNEHTLKYYLYTEYFDWVPELPAENEILTTNFLEAQTKMFNTIKYTENYANFLVETSIVLHQLEKPYKTNFECPLTKILIDLAIPEKKIAILFVDQRSLFRVAGNLKPKLNLISLTSSLRLENGQNLNKFAVDTLTELKKHILEGMGGWKIVDLEYESLCGMYNTTEKRDQYILGKIKELL